MAEPTSALLRGVAPAFGSPPQGGRRACNRRRLAASLSFDQPKSQRTRFSMSRIAELGFAMAVAAVLSLDATAAAQAALSQEEAAPIAAEARPMVLAQAPGAQAPNVEANVAELRQRLQITPAQEPQFNALANIMRENARTMPAAPPPQNVSAVEGLRLAIRYAQQDLDGMKRLLPAMQSLYAVLTPAQRQAADQVFRQGPGE
jgi:periplasmic protein CpxP/Spy